MNAYLVEKTRGTGEPSDHWEEVGICEETTPDNAAYLMARSHGLKGVTLRTTDHNSGERVIFRFNELY